MFIWFPHNGKLTSANAASECSRWFTFVSRI